MDNAISDLSDVFTFWRDILLNKYCYTQEDAAALASIDSDEMSRTFVSNYRSTDGFQIFLKITKQVVDLARWNRNHALLNNEGYIVGQGGILDMYLGFWSGDNPSEMLSGIKQAYAEGSGTAEDYEIAILACQQLMSSNTGTLRSSDIVRAVHRVQRSKVRVLHRCSLVLKLMAPRSISGCGRVSKRIPEASNIEASVDIIPYSGELHILSPFYELTDDGSVYFALENGDYILKGREVNSTVSAHQEFIDYVVTRKKSLRVVSRGKYRCVEFIRAEGYLTFDEAYTLYSLITNVHNSMDILCALVRQFRADHCVPDLCEAILNTLDSMNPMICETFRMHSPEFWPMCIRSFANRRLTPKKSVLYMLGRMLKTSGYKRVGFSLDPESVWIDKVTMACKLQTNSDLYNLEGVDIYRYLVSRRCEWLVPVLNLLALSSKTGPDRYLSYVPSIVDCTVLHREL